ncbi:hypothetical protein [Rhizobium sp. Root1220]|uniref:DUF6984 family protein n=1 Tax=Rhizobium sp. Root1220 TaxID=1736432 RepID=UPI0006F26703|nr:hypothetical protein [Rhizobium sp. Root1220]KQV63748.1 hypothetical protein ASC90_17345 [Rhizobium sp. Root1220]
MTVIWRELTAAERQIIQRLVRHASHGNIPATWDSEHYRAAEIDAFGSIRLRPRDKADLAAGAAARPVASAYFDDKEKPDPYGPLVDIILFEAAGVLCELQICRSDGGAILREIEADGIFLITCYEQHG